jgi:hypothetical protein
MTRLALVAATALLVGCGIDRGGAPTVAGPTFEPTQSSPTPTYSVGPITNVTADSVTVNNTVARVTAVQVEVNNATSTLDQLKLGEYAAVFGSTSQSAVFGASRISISSDVIGSATAFDSNSNTLTVLGQQVIISEDTNLEAPLSVADLSTPQPLRIAGIADGDGNIFATFIGPAAGAPSRLTGYATMIDEANFQFKIGQQLVSYGAAFVFELPETAPQQNDRITVTGTFENGVFLADTVRLARLLPAFPPTGAIVRFTAAVTSPLAGDAFSVGFVEAVLDSDATVSNGARTDIVPGAVITVFGRWSADQNLTIEVVDVVRPPAS